MSFLSLIIEIAIIGVIAWAVTTYIAMPPPIKTVITIVAVVAVVFIALQAFGIHLPNPSVPKISN